MAFFGRIAYRDPRWNVWLNYLDVQDNFNAEAGFVQRRGVRTTKAYFSPTPRPWRGGIRMIEPMFVLTYITDQQNRMVGRHAALHDRHDAAGRVVHQRDLPAESRRARRAVPDPARRAHSGRQLQHSTSGRSPTTPARRGASTSASRASRCEFYDGTRADRVGARSACARPASCRRELQYSRNDVKMPWGDFVVESGHRCAWTTPSRRAMTIRSLTQYNT